MASTHGMLDKGFGPANQSEALNIYNKIASSKDPEVKESDASSKLKVVDGKEQTIPVEYLVDPMAAGVSFFIAASDPNPKLPDPEIFTRRVSFFFDEEVKDDTLANREASYDTWMNPKTFRIRLKEGAPDIRWESSSRTLVVTLQFIHGHRSAYREGPALDVFALA
jgi:hypothetical protein